VGVETHGRRVVLHDIDRLRCHAVADEPMPEIAAADDLLRSAQAFNEAFSPR
jgi:hypothetical protein